MSRAAFKAAVPYADGRLLGGPARVSRLQRGSVPASDPVPAAKYSEMNSINSGARPRAGWLRLFLSLSLSLRLSLGLGL